MTKMFPVRESLSLGSIKIKTSNDIAALFRTDDSRGDSKSKTTLIKSKHELTSTEPQGFP